MRRGDIARGSSLFSLISRWDILSFRWGSWPSIVSQVREGGVLVAFPNTDSSMEKMHLLAAEIMKVKHSNMITDRTLRCRKTRNYSWSLHLHSNLSISSNRNTLRYCEMTLLVWTVVPHVYDIKPTGCFPGLMTCMTRGASA